MFLQTRDFLERNVHAERRYIMSIFKEAPAQYFRVWMIKPSWWQLNNSSLLFLFEKKTSIASLFTE
jgi:hypothetical protein